MEIKVKKLTDLKPAPYNPRTISDKAMAGLRASIDRFGLVEPIVFNKRSGNVIGGHQRLKVLEEQGVKKTQVVVVDLTKREEKALNVTLNNPHVTGEFIPDLQNILEGFKLDIPDAFEALNLDELYRPGPKDGKTDPDDIPASAPATVKTGEIWQLGKHRVMCGDSTKAEDVEALMQGEKADAILTDPPYGIEQKGVPHDTPEEHYELINNAVKQFPITDGVIVAFQSTRTFPTYLDAIRANGFTFERILSLYKEAQCTYPWRGWILISESILVASIGRPKWQDVHPYTHDAYKVSEVSHEIDDSIGWHGSIKPIVVLLDITKRICPEGSIVFDGFLGSGSTLIACEQLDRICYGMEIEPHYCDVIIKRYEDFTSAKARKLN